MPPPELLTPAEAADRLKVGRKTVYRWIAAGRLPTVTLPSGRSRIPADALNETLVDLANKENRARYGQRVTPVSTDEAAS